MSLGACSAQCWRLHDHFLGNLKNRVHPSSLLQSTLVGEDKLCSIDTSFV